MIPLPGRMTTWLVLSCFASTAGSRAEAPASPMVTNASLANAATLRSGALSSFEPAWTSASASLASVEPAPVCMADDGFAFETALAAMEAEPLDTEVDTWTLAARVDGAACREELASRGFVFKTIPDRSARDEASGCGMPHPVIVTRGPTGIAYDPPLAVDCAMARALGPVERVIQEEASARLEAKIVRIWNFGAYACRPREKNEKSAPKGETMTAHAFGSALDIAAFYPDHGPPVSVAFDFGESKLSSAAREKRRAFLHGVLDRIRREGDLTYAIGPDFDALHQDHFHLDRGGWHFWNQPTALRLR